MTDFFHSWAFAFIIGLFIGGIIGFFTTALCAISARASREEERIENSLIYEATKKEEARRGCKPDVEIAMQNNPRTD